MILYEIENGIDEEYINVVKERISKFPQLMQDMLSDTYTKFCIVRKIPNVDDAVSGKYIRPNTIYLRINFRSLKRFNRTIAHECAHFIDDKIISLCGYWSERSEEFLNCVNNEKDGIDVCFPSINEDYTEDLFLSEIFAIISGCVLTSDIKHSPNCISISISSEIPLTSESVKNFYIKLPKIYKQYSMEVSNKYIKDFGRKDAIRFTFQWTLFERELYLFYVYNSSKNSFIITKRFPENNYELILGKVYIKNGHIYNSKNEDCIKLLKEFYIQDIDKYRTELYYIWFFERIWYCQDN